MGKIGYSKEKLDLSLPPPPPPPLIGMYVCKLCLFIRSLFMPLLIYYEFICFKFPICFFVSTIFLYTSSNTGNWDYGVRGHH